MTWMSKYYRVERPLWGSGIGHEVHATETSAPLNERLWRHLTSCGVLGAL